MESTTTLLIATGIVNIWSAPAETVAKSFHQIEAAYPGRFLLGIGAGHREHTSVYRKPYEVLVEYLDELDAAGVPVHRRVIAALGPRVLELAARRSAGAHPTMANPKHTKLARLALGNGRLLAPVENVLINPDADAARAIARKITGSYLSLNNYVSNWRRLGFNDDDFTAAGSDRLIDALVAHGTAEVVADRVNEHRAAGADHVAILPVGPAELLSTLTELALPLGLLGE
jgi:probable F420-dependent oxidoreductase